MRDDGDITKIGSKIMAICCSRLTGYGDIGIINDRVGYIYIYMGLHISMERFIGKVP